MGAGASADAPPYATAEEALAAGKTQEEIDAFMAKQKEATAAAPAEAEAAAPAEAEAAPAEAAAAEAAPAEAEAAAAAESAPLEITTCTLQTFQAAMDGAIAEGKWPLLLDSNEGTPLIT